MKYTSTCEDDGIPRGEGKLAITRASRYGGTLPFEHRCLPKLGISSNGQYMDRNETIVPIA